MSEIDELIKKIDALLKNAQGAMGQYDCRFGYTGNFDGNWHPQPEKRTAYLAGITVQV